MKVNQCNMHFVVLESGELTKIVHSTIFAMAPSDGNVLNTMPLWDTVLICYSN